MKLKSEYPFRYIVTYIPSYYCNLKEWQVGNRRAVYNFKKGFISEEYKRKIKKGGEMRGETNFFLTYPLRSENCKRRTSGAQVESLIDRREDIINLCEIKYADDEYVFDSERERKQRNRKTAFKPDTKTRNLSTCPLSSPTPEEEQPQRHRAECRNNGRSFPGLNRITLIIIVSAMKEMNYYMLYLEKVLLDNDLAKRYGKAFVEARSELASESYEQMRRSGYTVEQAHEFAMSILLRKRISFVA